MMKVRRFEDLVVWRKAEELAVLVYEQMRGSPFSRDFPLCDQMRRAAISIPSNIAEGFERYGSAEFRHFLSIARGSAAELRTQIHLAHRLDYIPAPIHEDLTARCLEISRLLAALRR